MLGSSDPSRLLLPDKMVLALLFRRAFAGVAASGSISSVDVLA